MSSFTRSISQRLTRRRRRGNTENAPVAPPAPAQDALALASSTTIVPQNKPGLLTRGMDRIRKSLRIPSRRGGGELVRGEAGAGASSGTGGPDAWHPDEGAVRAGLCTFQVKYLGSVEVFESRGMGVCEGALKMLREKVKTPIKAVLHVSGDGLRLVDQQNHRGLIVDQTIEKVSFCAPDRNNSRGFAYICREGSSRRWMCHGFQAVHESGERLSHAVGCAFAVCLERKKKRDEENTVAAEKIDVSKALNPDWEKMGSSSTDGGQDNGLHRTNAAYQSFRRSMPMAERVRDPQGAIVTSSLPPNGAPLSDTSKLPPPSIAKPRPSSNPALFERQGSLRAPANDAANQQFRRQFSLRNYEKPYASPSSIMGDTITEADEGAGSSLLLPELADLVPMCSPAMSPNPQHQNVQAAPTHPTAGPTPIAAWGAPATNGVVQQAPGSLYQRPANAVSTGFTPSNEISVSTMWSGQTSPPSSSRSKADEWLASTLQSMNVGSGQGTPLGPLSPRATTSSACASMDGNAPPPSHPPPPLPPAAVLASPDRPVGERLFERQENIAPVQWSNGVQHTQQGVKSSFPTVFSPDQPFPPSTFSTSAVQPVLQAPAVDPFDVQWSRLALSSNSGSA